MRKHIPEGRIEPRKKRELTKEQEELKKKLRAYIQKKVRSERVGFGKRKRKTGASATHERSSYPELREQIAELATGDVRTSYERIIGFGAEFIQTAGRGNAEKLQAFIEEGFPVTYQDPMTGETAIHAAAASQARKALRVLLKSKDCDFLLRDSQGRLASELAYLYGGDVAMSRLLGIKERIAPFGGKLQIRGESGKGTRATVCIPVSSR